MKYLIKFISILAIISIFSTVHAGGDKKSCTFKARHCLAESDTSFKTFNGNDTVRAISSSSGTNVPKGQDQTITCHWDNCDFKFYSNTLRADYWITDSCKDVTLKENKQFVDGLVACS